MNNSQVREDLDKEKLQRRLHNSTQLGITLSYHTRAFASPKIKSEISQFLLFDDNNLVIVEKLGGFNNRVKYSDSTISKIQKSMSLGSFPIQPALEKETKKILIIKEKSDFSIRLYNSCFVLLYLQTKEEKIVTVVNPLEFTVAEATFMAFSICNVDCQPETLLSIFADNSEFMPVDLFNKLLKLNESQLIDLFHRLHAFWELVGSEVNLENRLIIVGLISTPDFED